MCLHSFQSNIEEVDPRGRTPLHLAVSLGHLESVRVLLRHGADVSKENEKNWTGENRAYELHISQLNRSLTGISLCSIAMAGFEVNCIGPHKNTIRTIMTTHDQ